MSECPRCGRQGTHACPPGPPLSRLYSDALAELAYQRARKESAERVVRLLVEALRYARDYVPVCARAQTMEPTTLPSTYYIYGRKPLHPVITAAHAAAIKYEAQEADRG